MGISLAVLAFMAYHYGCLDVRFQLRGSLPLRLPIVIVSIDLGSFDALDLPWPWPHTLHAELIHKLATQQAALIALDILLTEPKATPLRITPSPMPSRWREMSRLPRNIPTCRGLWA